MIVVSDTGPIRYLVLIDRIELLRAFYAIVLLPRAVVQELDRPATPQRVRSWIQAPPEWVRVEDPREEMTFVPELGSGERAALSLAVERSTSILVDDLDARRVARRLGLVSTGTLGVLARAHGERIDDIHEALTRLATTNFHLTPGLIDLTIRIAEAQRQP